MTMQDHILAGMREEFDRWEELLTGLSEEEIVARRMPSDLSIKDVIAHLMAWQQRSIARLQAAKENREPEFPKWPAELNPEEEDADPINAWIRESYGNQPWSEVHRAWREGFLRFLELGAAISEYDLLDGDRFFWMKGYPLADVMTASYLHHHEDHYMPLVAWLKEHGS